MRPSFIDDVDRLHEWMQDGAEPNAKEAGAHLGRHREPARLRLAMVPGHWRYRCYEGYRYSFRYALNRAGQDRDEEYRVKHYPKRSEWPGWNGCLGMDNPRRRCRAFLQWMPMETRELARLARCSRRTARESIERWRTRDAVSV